MNNYDLMYSVNPEANGGTELMMRRLYDGFLPRELLQNFQIVPSRIRGELDQSKVRIFYAHDLPGDPESEFLRNGGWKRFHRFVFVSNWQMQAYINEYQIPWSVCMVLQNSIVPIQEHEKPKDKIKLVYFSTPHRGLNILYHVFDKLSKEMDDIELDVFSSFKLYGWEERNKPFQDLLKACEDHPKINYHDSVSNETIRENLTKSHILAYPCTWQETSCLVLMEAMSAGLLCIHPNYGALPETAANWTLMYHWNENPNAHASMFYQVLKEGINEYRKGDPSSAVLSRLTPQKSYASIFYNWEYRKHQWKAFLESLVNLPRESEEAYFSYKVM